MSGGYREIFLRSAQRQRLARAQRSGFADFLLRHGAQELAFRLGGVKRDFSAGLELGAPCPILPAAQGRRIIRMGPLAATGAHLVGDDEVLPFAPQSFDLVASLLTLQFANDLPGALAQIRRILRPDGLLIGALAGGRTLHELRACLTDAQSALEGGVSPRVAPFADVRDIGALLQRAGLALPVTDCETLTVRYDNMFALMADLRAMGATNTLKAGYGRPLRRATLMRAAQIYAERFADQDGRLRATFDLVWFSGWAPHESQQKPARRGSATIRLEDALKGTGGGASGDF
jgi:SAM-dependent methyltransferase